MKLTGSQIFVEVLVEQGVDTLFGYPGGAVLNLYDELYKNSDRIRHVLTAHEQGRPTRRTATPVPQAAPAWCWPPAAPVPPTLSPVWRMLIWTVRRWWPSRARLALTGCPEVTIIYKRASVCPVKAADALLIVYSATPPPTGRSRTPQMC